MDPFAISIGSFQRSVLSNHDRVELTLDIFDALISILDVIVLQTEPQRPGGIFGQIRICSCHQSLHSLFGELVVRQVDLLNSFTTLKNLGEFLSTLITNSIAEKLQNLQLRTLFA